MLMTGLDLRRRGAEYGVATTQQTCREFDSSDNNVGNGHEDSILRKRMR